MNTIFELKKSSHHRNEKIIKWMLITASIISILTTFGILFSILFEAVEFFQLRSFWYFFTGTEWSPGTVDSKFGAVPIFTGTIMITSLAMVIAVPVGLGSAIYMSQYASAKARGKLKPFLEILAGIPTVVYGFFAAITVAPFIVQLCASVGLTASFNSALASGIVMGIMIIPVISSLSDDVIKAVPASQSQASLALGMTKGETIRNIILPSAMPGIIAATLLGLSKAIGETMIVVMAAGLRPNLSINPLEDMTTVTVRIVDALVGDQAFNSPATLSAFALGLALFVFTLTLNTFSLILVRKFKKKYKVNTL